MDINNKLEFEGEFRYNRKSNGIGYDENCNKIYELINGNGKVKEYDNNNKFLIFEGEYLNVKKSGKGKKYKDGNIIFDGEYLDGKRNGKGCEFEQLYLIYSGDYVNGVRNGKGREFYFKSIKSPNEVFLKREANNEWTFGLKFDGEFLNGEKRKGKLYYHNGIIEFEGEFSHGKKYKGKEYNY